MNQSNCSLSFFFQKESSCERVILNDLNRTFPAHEYFKEAGGIGQEALYKLSRVSFINHFVFFFVTKIMRTNERKFLFEFRNRKMSNEQISFH